MPMGYTVSTDVIRQAATLVYEAQQFFNGRYNGLHEIWSDATGNPFHGGHGKTGAYQGALDRFSKRFEEVLQEFVDDEGLFVTFLGQVHTRLNQTANLYDATEEQNTHRMTSIANQLDGQDG